MARKLCFLLLLLYAKICSAQHSEADENFRSWLGYKGLDAYVSLETKAIYGDTLFLFLRFQQSPPNADLWVRMQNESTSKSMSRLLFENAAMIYRVQPQNLVLQFRDTYTSEPNDLAALFFDTSKNDLRDTVVHFMTPKAQATPRKISFKPNNLTKKAKIVFDKRTSYERIVALLLKLYAEHPQKVAAARCNVGDTDSDTLSVRLWGLKGWAVGKGKDWLCSCAYSWTRGFVDCNLREVELLEVKVWLSEPDSRTGVSDLKLWLTGRYTSGLYDVVNWSKGYDIEELASDDVRIKADELSGLIEKLLEK